LPNLNQNTYDIIKGKASSQGRSVINYIELLIKAIFEGSTVIDIDNLIETYRFKRFKETAENADLSKTTSDEPEDLEDDI
jgi:hypothetical protein